MVGQIGCERAILALARCFQPPNDFAFVYRFKMTGGVA